MGMSFEAEASWLAARLELAEIPCGAGAALVCPGLQGRVLTSGVAGQPGFGWVNHALIESGEPRPHINPFGGEDRLWVGPEGGAFAVFFPPGSPFEFESWQTPAAIDTEPWQTASRTAGSIVLTKEAEFLNWSGTRFAVRFERTVRAIAAEEAERMAECPLAGDWLGFESVNRVQNLGPDAWRPETGLLSLWVLGMFHPGPATVVGIPLSHEGAQVESGYFGPVPAGRLAVHGRCAFFRGDGRERGKVGVGADGATGRLCGWDGLRRSCTIVQHDPQPAPHGFVNSRWEHQSDPYGGDVLNSYNDGPVRPGQPPLGPFFELETSSPALALGPGEWGGHRHRTLHLMGAEAAMAFESLCGTTPERALGLVPG
jgi:hypothetical protein